MPGLTIRKPLPCAKCGYDLNGLEARGRCPECGSDNIATLALRLDIAAEELTRSAALVRTAWALYLACAGSVLGCFIAVSPILKHAGTAVDLPAWLFSTLNKLSIAAPRIALFGTTIGLIGLLLVLPWDRRRPVRRARFFGSGGFLGWMFLSVQPPSYEIALMALAALAMVVAALTPLLRELTPHSRFFSTARHATQSTRDLLIAAAVCAATGAVPLYLGQYLPADLDPTFDVALYSGIVAFSSAMFLVVGLGYRLVNAHWVLLSVRRPPPRLSEVLGE